MDGSYYEGEFDKPSNQDLDKCKFNCHCPANITPGHLYYCVLLCDNEILGGQKLVLIVAYGLGQCCC